MFETPASEKVHRTRTTGKKSILFGEK